MSPDRDCDCVISTTSGSRTFRTGSSASASLLFPHSTEYKPTTISTAPKRLSPAIKTVHQHRRTNAEDYFFSKFYLPICSFSSRKKEPNTATIMSINGLKMEVKSGPFVRMHHVITTVIIPEATIPWVKRRMKGLSRSNNGEDKRPVKNGKPTAKRTV